jgi:transposase
MIKLAFTAKQIESLEVERYTHPHPKVQRKMEALYLKSLGLEHQLICQICRIEEPTLVRYLRAYEKDGLAGLKRLGYAGQPSPLRSHQQSLEEYFRQHPPATSAEAQNAIEKLTGVHRSPTQVREFLHRLGMKHRKTGFVPGRADTPEKQAEQAAYVKKTSPPDWRKPRRAGGWFFSWMPLILSIRCIWDSCGVSAGFF